MVEHVNLPIFSSNQAGFRPAERLQAASHSTSVGCGKAEKKLLNTGITNRAGHTLRYKFKGQPWPFLGQQGCPVDVGLSGYGLSAILQGLILMMTFVGPRWSPLRKKKREGDGAGDGEIGSLSSLCLAPPTHNWYLFIKQHSPQCKNFRPENTECCW